MRSSPLFESLCESLFESLDAFWRRRIADGNPIRAGENHQIGIAMML
jgi:hypothetical protein